jgi:hypothetical protein
MGLVGEPADLKQIAVRSGEAADWRRKAVFLFRKAVISFFRAISFNLVFVLIC